MLHVIFTLCSALALLSPQAKKKDYQDDEAEAAVPGYVSADGHRCACKFLRGES